MGLIANIKASDRQTIVDLAAQELGSVEAAFLLAVKNDLSLSDVLAPGQVLNLSGVQDQTLVNYFKQKNIKPATGLSDDDNSIVQQDEGIGYWAIGVDFIIS